MAWFRIDDDWLYHPKVRRAGRDGRDLWVAAGVMCAKYSTDGLVEGALVPEYATSAGVSRWKVAAKALVTADLWHNADTIAGCKKCKEQVETLNAERAKAGEQLLELGPDDFFFHEWWTKQQPRRAKRSEYAKMAEDRLRALHRNSELCRAIQLRDRDHCRYCGTPVNWNDRRSAKAPTYDHVDPLDFDPEDGGNSLDKVVVACRTCNGRKGKRTPEEWAADPKQPGHLLRPPYEPPPVTGVTKPNPKPNPGSTPDLPGPADPPAENLPGPLVSGPENLPGPSRDARLGSGRVGADPGLDPGTGPGRVGLDRVGLGLAGLGLAGLVRDGTGPGLAGQGLVGFGPGREPPSGGDPTPPPDRTRAEGEPAEDSRR